MPWINIHLPGAALNPLNVGDLTLDWWRNYRARVIEIIEANKKHAESVRRTRSRK